MGIESIGGTAEAKSLSLTIARFPFALTLHFELYALRDGGWNAVRCYAQIRRHVESADFRYRQNFPVDDVHCSKTKENAYQGKFRAYRGNLIFSPFSPLIDISSPSSLRHITYGSGKPLALHVNVTFVPSRTTISLLVIDSTITGGTGQL